MTKDPALYGGPMASVKQFQVTFDCAEPERVARFWCEVLGYVVAPPPKGFATWDDFDRTRPPEKQGSAFACLDPSGAGPRLFFQRVPEGKPGEPRTGLHLDLMPTDRTAPSLNMVAQTMEKSVERGLSVTVR